MTQSWETIPNHKSGKIKLTPPENSHTTVLLVSSLNFSLPNCSRDIFTVMWKARMAVSSSGKCLGWQCPVLLLALASKRPQCRFCFVSAIKEPAQPFQAGFNILYYNLSCHSIPHHPPSVNIPDTTSYVQLANFLKLFGGNFCDQQLVLGKLSNTVKINGIPFV